MTMDRTAFAVRLDSVTKEFGRCQVLKNISWTVPKGQIVGLLGLNGAGKTTLMRILLGLASPSAGHVAIDGAPLSAGTPALRERVGYVPERPVIPGAFTPNRLESVGRHAFSAWDADQYHAALERFHIPRSKPLYVMSQGQRTMTALAFALAHHADLLLLDEPTNGLDPLIRREFLTNLIEESYDAGRTVIVASHRLDEIEHIAQDIAVLHRGALVAAGPLEELLMQDRILTWRQDAACGDVADLPGAHRVRWVDKQAAVYVRGFAEGPIREAMERRGISHWTVRGVSLEEFFEERVTTDVG